MIIFESICLIGEWKFWNCRGMNGMLVSVNRPYTYVCANIVFMYHLTLFGINSSI